MHKLNKRISIHQNQLEKQTNIWSKKAETVSDSERFADIW